MITSPMATVSPTDTLTLTIVPLHWDGDFAASARSCGTGGSSTSASGATASGHSRSGLWDPHGDGEPLAVDLDIDLAFDLRFVVLDSRRPCGGHTGKVEDLFDPLGGVLVGPEVVVFEDRDISRNRGGDAFNSEFSQSTQVPG